MRSSKLAFILVTAALIAPLAFAQQQHANVVQPNTLYVGADGKFEAPPDTAIVQFNISAQEDSARSANERATRAAQQIREILHNNGIDLKNAQIGFFSISPVYDYRNPKRKLVAYRVSSSVQVKLKDFSKIAAISQQFADMDVTENQNISYTLEDIDAAKTRAVQDAFQRARGEAAALAQAGGRSLSELLHASIDTQEQVPIIAAAPMQRMMKGAMAEAADASQPVPSGFTPQTVLVTARVNAMFGLK